MNMDFNDRLRDHLHTQNDDLLVVSEGADTVRSRSRRRKQRRTGAAMMATLAVVLLVGGWLIDISGDTTDANLATEGDGDSTAASPSATVNNGDSAAAIDVTNVLPEPGAALVLTQATAADAPGGYNTFQNGRANGLYYVVSTAPGATYDGMIDGEPLRNDTFYTFDGAGWTQSNLGDRYVSSFDNSTTGLLYAVSTGSPTSNSLEVGTSTNAGGVWDWTEIDLTAVFGADEEAWPPYAVQVANRGGQRLVVVHTNGAIDWEEAAALATNNGADIPEGLSQVVSVDPNGIGWTDALGAQNSCLAAQTASLTEQWNTEPEGPEFDFDRELTEAEAAELQAWSKARLQRAFEINAQALRAVASIPGCEPFVKCSTQQTAYYEQTDAQFEALYGEFGFDINDDVDLSSEQRAAYDQLRAENDEAMETWIAESGCDEVLGEGVGIEDLGIPNYVTWAELGVTPPESWKPIDHTFLVDGDVVTDLGRVFDGQDGYLIDVRSTSDSWQVTFDTTAFSGVTPTENRFTTWTSTDSTSWTSSTNDSSLWSQDARLSNGTSFSVNWDRQQAQLLRSNPDGTTDGLLLANLAPEINTTNYSMVNVKAGEYGVVAWAVDWSSLSDPSYDSLLLYSPDGIGWGVTEVADAEVIDAIVGGEGVLLFLNDPARPEGTPQPYALAQAE